MNFTLRRESTMKFNDVEMRVSSHGDKKRILTVGSSNMDLVLNMNRVPMAGETVIDLGTYSSVPGGKGANSALAVARLGADSVFCARLGKDANGELLSAFYKKSGIDTRFVKRDAKLPTGLAAIMVESSGANRIVVYPGANMSLERDDIEEAFMCYPDALLMNFEISKEAVYSACEFASARGIPKFIDGGPAVKSIDLEKLGKVEIFSPNESETHVYTGIRPDTINDCLRAASALYNRMDVKYIVIKLGDRGCFVYDGIHYNICESYEVDAVDTTAAGDAFTAAMTVEYIKTGDVIKACRYANAVGAMVVTRAGAAPSIPRREDVLEFIRSRELV